MALEDSCGFFPAGTIHVAIVDPGVGSTRAAIALETEHAYYIGPNNGICDHILKRERLLRAVKLENPRYRLSVVSATFHGRDIFAPAAALLANGTPLSAFGSTLRELTKLKIPTPVQQGDRLQIHILRVDHFGNLITDLLPPQFTMWNPENAAVEFKFTHTQFIGVVQLTYADAPENTPVAYFGSGGRLEVAIRNGNAAAFFKEGKGFSISLGKL